jgi:hypothetical protein
MRAMAGRNMLFFNKTSKKPLPQPFDHLAHTRLHVRLTQSTKFFGSFFQKRTSFLLIGVLR